MYWYPALVSFAPPGLRSFLAMILPTACAVGCILTPLRGFREGIVFPLFLRRLDGEIETSGGVPWKLDEGPPAIRPNWL